MITPSGRRHRRDTASSVADMDEQRGPRTGPPEAWGPGGPPRWWRHGPPGWSRRAAERDEDLESARRARWPWPSTALLTAFVVIGSGFADHAQAGERAALDPWGRVLLFVTGALLLWRWRHPVAGRWAARWPPSWCTWGRLPVRPGVPDRRGGLLHRRRRRAPRTPPGRRWASCGRGTPLMAHLAVPLAAPCRGRRRVLERGTRRRHLGRGASLALSELARARREQWASERAERARADRRRADEERLRIARELHDVLAHSISVINVQAGVGLALLDSGPRAGAHRAHHHQGPEQGGARRGAAGARHPAHPRATPRALRPPASTGSPNWSNRRRSAGLTVDVEGKPPRLSPGTDLAAFRIVQEALTNVVRHSGSRARARPASAGDGSTAAAARSTTTAPRRAPTRAAAATGWPGCGSGRRLSVAPSRRARGPTAASASWPPCRSTWGTRHRRRTRRRRKGTTGDPRTARRRPVVGTGRFPRAAGRAAGHRGGRGGGRRRGGRARDPRTAARRRPHGHPHAPAGRPRRDPPGHRRRTAARREGGHAHHLRTRRVRLRGDPLRRLRLPGQGHRAGRTAARRTGGGRRRRAAVTRGDAPPDRRVRSPLQGARGGRRRWPG
ncbi:hypothetical protein STENM223S_11002 [Streptomyces tendae]